MFIFFLCAACAFLGFLTILSIRINKEFNASPFINKYLLIVFIISSTRFLIYGIQPYIVSPEIKFILKNAGETAYVFIVPLIYMYFESLLTEKKWNRKMTFHFIVPVLILLLNYSRFFIADEHVAQLFKKLMFLIYIPFSLSYAVVTFYQLKSRMWIRKSDINLVEKQNLLLKKWSWVLISLFMLMAAKATLFIAFKGFDYNNNDNSDLLWSGAIHWIIIFLCFLANPDIIYGYNAISKKIENQIKHHVLMSDLWILQVDSSSITNIKDQKLAEKINFELQNHLIKIEEASFNGDFFRTAEANMDDFSTQIGIPTSHLSYIFKYHTSVSFTDFKKIVRIQDAIKLLKSDYLKTNTIEALAMEVGFSSYSPFFSSFKNITGLAPLEYIKTMQ